MHMCSLPAFLAPLEYVEYVPLIQFVPIALPLPLA